MEKNEKDWVTTFYIKSRKIGISEIQYNNVTRIGHLLRHEDGREDVRQRKKRMKVPTYSRQRHKQEL